MTNTAPFNARAAREVPYGVGLTWDAKVTAPAWPTPITLAVTDVELVEDETMWPRCKATVTAAVPEDAAVLAAIDPRGQLAVVDVYATYIYADGTKDHQQMASLLLQSREIVNEPGRQELVLVAQSDEMLIVDQEVSFNRGPGLPFHSWTTANDAIRGAVELFSGGSVRAFASEFPTSLTLPAAYHMEVDEGTVTDRVGLVRSWADAIGGVLYCDALGVWRLEYAPILDPESAAILTSGPTGTITRTSEKLSREDWANRVYVTYGQTVGSGATVHHFAPIPFTEQPYDRVYIEERPLPAGVIAHAVFGTIDPPDPAVQPLLERMLTRGASLDFDTVAHLWLHVGSTVTVTTPTTPQQRALIAKVTTRADGSQSITTRQP